MGQFRLRSTSLDAEHKQKPSCVGCATMRTNIYFDFCNFVTV